MSESNKKYPLISVIVPVYNLEKYLSKCISSILSQTYVNFELLLINDGSVDSSGIICDEYAAKDSRVRVFHRMNQGVGATRNYGLDKSAGEYIAFVDGDDYIEADYLEVLYRNLQETQSDISCCNYMYIKNGEKDSFYVPIKKDDILSGSKALFQNLYSSQTEMKWGRNIWASLFQKTILEGQRFGNLKYGEDTLFMFEVFRKEPQVCFSKYSGYYYVVREGSAMTQKGTQYEIERAIQTLSVYKYPFYEVELQPETRALAAKQVANIIQWGISATAQSEEKGLYNKYKKSLLKEVDILLETCRPYGWIDVSQKLKFWLYKRLSCPQYRLVLQVWRLVQK